MGSKPMLTEVQSWQFTPAPSLRGTERAAELERDKEWSATCELVAGFPNCPRCEAPPSPQRVGFTRDDVVSTQTLGECVMRSGATRTTWAFDCACGLQLKYCGHGELPRT